ncbi:MAG: hypothetical protein JO093_15635 [Acidobacteria bacterium]|nr:hypothetical protein [Acidobacteriota bacterium]MBV9187046.1 hypothetical protein [Acidobacteriota bacterium]
MRFSLRVWLTLGFVMALIGLFACVSAPRARPDIEAEAKAFTVPPGKAKLYVVRPSSFGLAVLYQVSIDGRIIGSLPAEAFLATVLPPGSHTVSLFNATSQENITLMCGPDKACFVRAGMRPTATSNRARLIEISEEEGRTLVRTNTMIETMSPP